MRIRESEKILLVESGLLGFGIRNTAQGIRNPTWSKIQVPHLDSFMYMGRFLQQVERGTISCRTTGFKKRNSRTISCLQGNTFMALTEWECNTKNIYFTLFVTTASTADRVQPQARRALSWACYDKNEMKNAFDCIRCSI